jgi:outer membrane beta-barrel protein
MANFLKALAAILLTASAALAQAAPPAATTTEPGTGTGAVIAGDDGAVQRIHVIEKRPFTEAGRWELSASLPVQVNPKFTVHAGVTAELAYHLRENLAAQVGLTWFPIAYQSTLSEELLTKADEAPFSAEAFLLQGAALAGLEFMPIYGKLNVFDGKILRLGFYLNAGLGAGKTRLQLRPSTSPMGRAYGDTGYRPVAALGGGFRVFVTERVTVRLELRDFAYSGYVSKVNGCGYADAIAIQAAAEKNSLPADGAVSSGCSPQAFGDSFAAIKLNSAGAKDLLKPPASAEVINNIAFQGGLSFLF